LKRERSKTVSGHSLGVKYLFENEVMRKGITWNGKEEEVPARGLTLEVSLPVAHQRIKEKRHLITVQRPRGSPNVPEEGKNKASLIFESASFIGGSQSVNREKRGRPLSLSVDTTRKEKFFRKEERGSRRRRQKKFYI